jgi:hypothetical protein
MRTSLTSHHATCADDVCLLFSALFLLALQVLTAVQALRERNHPQALALDVQSLGFGP